MSVQRNKHEATLSIFLDVLEKVKHRNVKLFKLAYTSHVYTLAYNTVSHILVA